MARASIMIVLFYLMHYSGRDLLLSYGIVSRPWSTFIVYAALFVVALLTYGKHLVSEWSRFRKRRKKLGSFLLELLLWSIASLAITVALYFTISGIFNISILPGGQGTVKSLVNNLPVFPSILLIAISVPLVQELTFRESIIGVNRRSHKFQLFLSSAISVVAFIMIQINSTREFYFYLPLAIAATAFYRRYDRNVWASTAFHALFNIISFLLLRFVPAFGSA